jgi:hypothetical protein
MPKIDITCIELVWPGQYDEDGYLVSLHRASLLFQKVVYVNQTHTIRLQSKKQHFRENLLWL